MKRVLILLAITLAIISAGQAIYGTITGIEAPLAIAAGNVGV